MKEKMTDLRSLHSIAAAQHEGMLTLAIVCIVLRILFGKRSEEIRKYTEATTLLASIGGTIGIFLSAITGSLLRPSSVLFNSSILLNKIMFTTFAAELWVLFLFVQVKYRDRLWKQKNLTVFALSLALLGYIGVVPVGSIGGDLTGKETILVPIYELLNTNPNTLWVASPFFTLAEALKGKPFSLTINALLMLQLAIILDVVIISVTMAYVFGLHEAFRKRSKIPKKQTQREDNERF